MSEGKEEVQQESKSPSSDAASPGIQYRVNRLGREVFVGDRILLVRAIQSRKVRGDDLIFDESEGLWSFARKHEVFIEATGDGLDELKRAREKKGNRSKWIRFIINVGVVGVILYLLTSYSKTIEFRLGEGDQDLESEFRPSSFSGKGDSGEQSEGGGGEGDGDGAGQGKSDGTEGYAELNELLTENSPRRRGQGEEIQQIFDLNAEGMRDNPLVQENTLSDDVLIMRAQEMSASASRQMRDQGKVGEQVYDMLQEARAIATFVAQRNVNHQGAGVLLSQLKTQLREVCSLLHSAPFCRIKDKHPDWRDAIIEAVLKREVLFGMSAGQVEAAWGRASRITRERDGVRHCYGPSCDRSVWISEGEVREFGKPKPFISVFNFR